MLVTDAAHPEVVNTAEVAVAETEPGPVTVEDVLPAVLLIVRRRRVS